MQVSPRDRLQEFVDVYKEHGYELTKNNISIYLQQLIEDQYKFDGPYEDLKPLVKELKAIDPKFKDQIKRCCDISKPVKPSSDGEKEKELPKTETPRFLTFETIAQGVDLTKNPTFLEIEKAFYSSDPLFFVKFKLTVELLDPKFFEKLAAEVTESNNLFTLVTEGFARLFRENGVPDLAEIILTFDNPFEKANLDLVYENLCQLTESYRNATQDASREAADAFFDISSHQDLYM